jgi:lysophospholipase L1-like esterase
MGQALTIGGGSGTTVPVPNGTGVSGTAAICMVSPDGTNYVQSGGGGGGGGLSGMTAGQVPIAATATTVTSSKALAGSGAAITTGPASSTSADCAQFTGTAGQIADSGNPCSGVSPSATINKAGGLTQADSAAAGILIPSHHHGDSLTAGFGSTTGSSYPTFLGQMLHYNPVNYGWGGYTCGDVSYSILARENPQTIGNPAVYVMCGQNDFNNNQTNIPLAVSIAKQYIYGMATWTALDSTNKIVGSALTTSGGTWSADTTWTNANGQTSSTAGNTIGCNPCVIGETGALIVWYKMSGGAGSFTTSVGGTAQINTVNGSTTVSSDWTGDVNANNQSGFPTPVAFGAAVYTGLTPSNAANISVSVLSGSVTILGFGFPQSGRSRGTTGPNFRLMNVTPWQGNENSSGIAQFNTVYPAIVSSLTNNGLNVHYLDANGAVDYNCDYESSAVGNCTSLSNNLPIHPSDSGYIKLARLVAADLNAVPSTIEQSSQTSTGMAVLDGSGALASASATNPPNSSHAVANWNTDSYFFATSLGNGIVWQGLRSDLYNFYGFTGWQWDYQNSVYATTTNYGSSSEVSWKICPGSMTTPSQCTTPMWLDGTGNLHLPGSISTGPATTGPLTATSINTPSAVSNFNTNNFYSASVPGAKSCYFDCTNQIGGYYLAFGMDQDTLNGVYAASTIYGINTEVAWKTCPSAYTNPSSCTTRMWLDATGNLHLPGTMYTGILNASGVTSPASIWNINSGNAFSNSARGSQICFFDCNGSLTSYLISMGLDYDALNGLQAATTIYGTSTEVAWKTCPDGYTNPSACTTRMWLDPSGNLHLTGTGSVAVGAVNASSSVQAPAITATTANNTPLVQMTTLYSAAGTPLPSCSGGTKGLEAVVQDATAPLYLTTYTSGGTVLAPVICNGTNWVTF